MAVGEQLNCRPWISPDIGRRVELRDTVGLIYNRLGSVNNHLAVLIHFIPHGNEDTDRTAHRPSERGTGRDAGRAAGGAEGPADSHAHGGARPNDGTDVARVIRQGATQWRPVLLRLIVARAGGGHGVAAAAQDQIEVIEGELLVRVQCEGDVD
jgi:hypothetical protein